MRRGQRVTLAVMQVAPSLLLSEIIRELTGHLRFFGVKIQTSYLDRGFACVDVIETLDQMRLPAVMACPLRGSATSRNPAVRLLLTTIGFLLANLWATPKRQLCRSTLPPHGFRRLPVEHFNDETFRLMRLKILLRHGVELRYGVQFTVPLPHAQP
jgi:hypothetical protein